MIRLALVGDIGSGKSHIAKQFGFPVFNADFEVANLYKKNRKCYKKLKKILPKYIKSFPVKKNKLLEAIEANETNIKKITRIIHPEVRSKMNIFIRKNKNKKIIVLDVPLLMEKKINRKNDILIFVDAKKKEINQRLKKRVNFKWKIHEKFKKLQLPLEIKRRKSNFVIKNNFKNSFIKKDVKMILNNILLNA